MARWESAHVTSKVIVCVNANFEISKCKALSLVLFWGIFLSHTPTEIVVVSWNIFLG